MMVLLRATEVILIDVPHDKLRTRSERYVRKHCGYPLGSDVCTGKGCCVLDPCGPAQKALQRIGRGFRISIF